MSEQIREQVSAFLDGELPRSETELLLKRLTRDAELREHFGRYALIGEAMRGTHRPSLSRGFATRVNAAIDGDPVPAGTAMPLSRSPRWWRPFAGAAMVAGVAAVAIVALQHRALAPEMGANVAANAPIAVASPLRVAVSTQPANLSLEASNALVPREPLSYTTPTSSGEIAPVATVPSGRMASYVFAHSKYSSALGRRGVLTDLLIEDDAPPAANPIPAAATAPAP